MSNSYSDNDAHSQNLRDHPAQVTNPLLEAKAGGLIMCLTRACPPHHTLGSYVYRYLLVAVRRHTLVGAAATNYRTRNLTLLSFNTMLPTCFPFLPPQLAVITHGSQTQF